MKWEREREEKTLTHSRSLMLCVYVCGVWYGMNELVNDITKSRNERESEET